MRATESTPGRIPALDGIRGLAISLVLWSHIILGMHVPNHPRLERMLELGRFAWSGVDLFFVLSGFLIGGILLDAVQSPFYFSTFYIRRAYRILPLYAVLIALALVVDRHYGWLPRYMFFLQNWWIAATGLFGPMFLGVTWSLAVEEQFYLTLPLLVRYLPRTLLLRVLLGAIVAAPIFRMLTMHFFRVKWVGAYVLMPCRADALCLGVLIAMATRSTGVWARILSRRQYVHAALVLASCAGLWMIAGRFQPFTGRAFGLEYSFLAVVYSLLLMSALVSRRVSSVFSWSPLRFIGIVAYGVYLFHAPLILTFEQASLYVWQTNQGITGLLASLVGVIASIGLAAVSWKYFEKPLVKRGHRQHYWATGKAVATPLAN